MSNTSPLEPCPPDGTAATTTNAPFLLLEPLHDSHLSKQIEPETEQQLSRSSKDTTTTEQESINQLFDHHLPPRPQLLELTEQAKRESRISIPASHDRIAPISSHSESRQSIYLADEDIQLDLRFYRRQLFLMLLWYLLCILTAGILFIADNWANNKFWIRFNTTPTSLNQTNADNKDKLIRIKSKHAEVDILPLKRVTFPSPIPFLHVFPPTLPQPYSSPQDAAARLNDHLSSTSQQYQHPHSLSYVDLVEYRATTLLLHPVSGKFFLLARWNDPAWSTALGSDTVAPEYSLSSTGLDVQTVRDRQALFGDNQVTVKGKSVVDLLIQEVLHPFYIFQIYSIVLWCNDEYVPYAIVIAVVSVIGIVATTVTTKAAIEKLKKMSRFSCDLSVLRPTLATTTDRLDEKSAVMDAAYLEKKQSDIASNSITSASTYTILNSEALVPGDIVDLGAIYTSHKDASNYGHRLIETLPCDLVLLEGDCIVNESMMTGESVPVVKAPISKADLGGVLAAGKDVSCLDKHILYSGTKLVRVRPGSSAAYTTRALVIRTGFSTAKGSLVRQMLFPRPINHKFYRDAFLFIGNLFVIAIIGMIATIIYFKIIGVSSQEIALRSLDVLTIAVPPALPATLSICITFSIARLKRRQIFCLSPQRINVAGMVNMFVFDKTGTLTEEGLDVMGVRMVKHGKFTELIQQQACAEMEDPAEIGLVEAMATAHDLNLLDGQPIGEPLEVKMLEWTGRTLQDEASLAPVYLTKEAALGAAHGAALDVDSRRPLTNDGTLARVPVILANPRCPSVAVIRTFEFSASLRRMSVVVKRHNSLSAQIYCKGAPESICCLCEPASLPSDYNYVLDRCTRAGFRVLAVAAKSIDALGWAGAQRLTRSETESSLEFLGLIIFENKLKAATTASIATIRDDARLPIKMCTGDSVLTAISVARECGILATNSEVFTPRLSGKGGKQIEWISVEDKTRTLDAYTLDAPDAKLKQIDLAVSGELLRALLEACSAETMARVLVHCKVFGRFSPEQKQELVERLQTLGYVVAMTGDGANDCGALKSADVGLSLSEAEASVAAPFTSKIKDISAITHLMREGRSTLTVSFAMFLFMSVYSLSEYFTVLLLYGKATSLDNAEYLFIDVFCILPVAVGLANSRPAKKLFRIAPEMRLSSAKPIVSMLAQVILGYIAQTVVYVVLHSKTWYEAPEFDPEDLTLNDMDNTALFRTSIFTYIIAGFAFSIGPPHRQWLVFNWILAPTLIVLAVFAFYFLFLTSGPFFTLFGFVDMPTHFSWLIFGVVIAQLVVAMLFEFCGVAIVARGVSWLFTRLTSVFGTQHHPAYKAVENAIYS